MVLSRTVLASSAVECMNSVLRMHQSGHRTLTQGMPDLKRLCTARALGLDDYSLQRRARTVAAPAPSSHPAFVELPAPIQVGEIG
jgi:hypothetical protein